MTSVAKSKTFDVELTGCRLVPLASYLKALAVLRLVAEQKDAEARGFWRGERFVLRSALDLDGLRRFFVEEWRPTPVLAPWNGGSGFWPSTSDEALRGIEASTDARLAAYRTGISLARATIEALGLTEAPEKGLEKTALLTRLRASAAEDALGWIDAVAVLTDEEPMYPALLGTGGNDGRQDFSNNFMQRVLVVLGSPDALDASLLGVAARVGGKGSMGQFSPTALGRSNPWDFVLTIEGSLMLAGAATRRLESGDGSTLAFPFHARTTRAPSLADGEDGHGELWLPQWSAPASFREVRKLFAEGRAKAGRGNASTGLDFARSVASLGVDRGLSEFVRFSFQARNGKNYFATPIGRSPTREVASARLLDDLDGWFDRLRQRAVGKNAPARVAVAVRRLETAMFEATERGDLAPVLLGLAEAERALARSTAFAIGAFLGPVPLLQPDWAAEVLDGSVEQRLAAALAARVGMRARLVPLEKGGRSFGRDDDSGVVFQERPLVDNLHALLKREDIESTQQLGAVRPEVTHARCSLTDIASFIDGVTDDVLLEKWLRALVLVKDGLLPHVPPPGKRPAAMFAILALVHGRRVGSVELPRTSGLLALACAGDAVGASKAAIRRLNATARPLPVASLVEPAGRMRRIAAALAFPLTSGQRRTLESLVLAAEQTNDEDADPANQESA